MQARRTSLRVGVLHAGQLVAEHTFDAPRTIRVGTRHGNDIVVPDARWPARMRLFSLGPLRAVLCLTRDVTGAIERGGARLDLETLRTMQLVPAGTAARITLADDMRGTLRVGDVTLLFQFVAPPSRQRAPRLPRDMRGGFIGLFDPVFTCLVVASLALHLVGARVLAELPPPPAPSLEDLDVRVMRFFSPRLPVARKAVPVADDPSSGPARGVSSTTRRTDRGNPRARLLKLLSARGGSGIGDLVGPSSWSAELAGQLARATGTRLPTSAGEGYRFSTGDPEPFHPELPDVTTPLTPLAPLPRPTATPIGAVELQAPDEVIGLLDPAQIARTLRARMPGIRACYERALKRSPQLHGRLVVVFTVGEDGRVEHASADESELGDEVTSCVVALFRRLRFPAPVEGTVSATFPLVFVPTQ